MKKCFKCGQEKELSEFYKQSQMADGHLGKCKECTRSDVRTNRKKNIDYYREYDRDRGNRQTREYILEYREKYPKKYKAMTMVNNAIRDGRMKRETCEICGNKAHAHHDNYDYPLSVRWLCSAHHKQWHMENGEGLNPF